MKKYVPLFCITISLISMQPDDVAHSAVKRMALKTQLIRDLENATGLSQEELYTLPTKHNGHVKSISRWIQVLPEDPVVWTNFYKQVVKGFYDSKIKKDLEPIFGKRCLQPYTFNGVGVNALKKKVISLEVAINPTIVMEVAFSPNDSQKLEADKKMTLEVAQELLETFLKENGCTFKEECKQPVRQSLTGYHVWDMLNAYVQSVRQIVYDKPSHKEVSQTIALYRQCRAHISEQLHALQAQREQERLEGAECIICLDAAEQIGAENRCTLICCKQFICKGCLDVYVKDTCPFCRSARANNRFF